MNKVRQDLLAIFQAGLDAVAGKSVVSQEIQNTQYPKTFHVVAIGKASDAMLQGIPEKRINSALLISKHGHISPYFQQHFKIKSIESDHPIPQEASLKAGVALIDYLQSLPKDEPCLFLISGGTSSLVEVLKDGWSLSELTELTDYLLANAYPIHEINAVRKKLSKIKGGGLWDYLSEREVHCLMISDVPNDDPADIGSGLLFPSLQHSTFPELPEKWKNKIKEDKQAIPLKNFNWEIIASLSIAKEASAKMARQLGYTVKVIPEFLKGEAASVALGCIKTLNENSNTLFIWGGETTVHLPQNAGKGGRNQHLALASAIAMTDLKKAYLLVAGTDGTDGMTDATGALVDNTTQKNGKQIGMDASDYLLRADSNTFFTKTGELIVTGGTGTNVMDLVIGVTLNSLD